jgi:hypothetical protein
MAEILEKQFISSQPQVCIATDGQENSTVHALCCFAEHDSDASSRRQQER